MTLNVQDIVDAKDDEELFGRLSAALAEAFPPELQRSRTRFHAALQAAPRGLRAMASIYDLDVSMTLDDLAWHFLNHNDERFLQETLSGLGELEAFEAEELFSSAWAIVKPYLPEIRKKDWNVEEPHAYLDQTGIQSKIDPLSEKMWAICDTCGKFGLMQYWLTYARNHPKGCVKGSCSD